MPLVAYNAVFNRVKRVRECRSPTTPTHLSGMRAAGGLFIIGSKARPKPLLTLCSRSYQAKFGGALPDGATSLVCGPMSVRYQMVHVASNLEIIYPRRPIAVRHIMRVGIQRRPVCYHERTGMAKLAPQSPQ
jgi:hypothetical protein